MCYVVVDTRLKTAFWHSHSKPIYRNTLIDFIGWERARPAVRHNYSRDSVALVSARKLADKFFNTPNMRVKRAGQEGDSHTVAISCAQQANGPWLRNGIFNDAFMCLRSWC